MIEYKSEYLVLSSLINSLFVGSLIPFLYFSLEITTKFGLLGTATIWPNDYTKSLSSFNQKQLILFAKCTFTHEQN